MRRAALCVALSLSAPVALCACGAPTAPKAAPPLPPPKIAAPPPQPTTPPPVKRAASATFDPRGTLVALDEAGHELFQGELRADEQGISFKSDDASRSFHVPLERFPGARGAADRKLEVAPSGVILVGASDGSLLGLDLTGSPLFQLGVRGPVSEINARPTGEFAVKIPAGEVIIDPKRWTVREPSANPPAPIRYLPEPPPGGRAPHIVISPTEAWALGVDAAGSDAVYRFDGKTWKQAPMSALGPKFNPKMGPARSEFVAVSLERGPRGQLLLLGTALGWYPGNVAVHSYTLRVYEWTGNAFQERADLKPALELTAVMDSFSEGQEPISYAAGPGGREIICFNVHCLAHGLPASFRVEDSDPPIKTKAPGWVYFAWEDGESSHGRRATTFAGDSLFRFDFSGVTRNGHKLVNGVTVFEDLANGKYPLSPDPHGPPHPPPRGDNMQGWTRGIWARRADDVWIAVGQRGWDSALFRWNGKELVSAPRPMPWIDDIWGSGPDDVWLSGDTLAHYDGHEYHRIPTIPNGAIVPGASGDVWIGGFRVMRATAVLPDLTGASAESPPIAPPSDKLDVSRVEPGLKMERLTLMLPGEAPMTAALGVEVGPSGVVWLHDRTRVVEVDGSNVRGLHRAAEGALLDCQRCLSPRAPGEGLFLTQASSRIMGLRRIAGGQVTDGLWLPGIQSVATAPNGDEWAISAAEDHAVARAFVRTKTGLRNVAGLPIAAYSNLAVRATDDVWLTGGLTAFHDGTKTTPAGEGILVHYDGKAFSRYRGPEGALLSVAAVGPREAWAAGYDGGVVHVKEGVATAYHLERDGTRLHITLRAVAATGPDDVWISGDGSTLIHFDGKAFSKVDVPSVGVDAALTAVVPPRDKAAGWLVGPRGIWRLTRAEKAVSHAQ